MVDDADQYWHRQRIQGLLTATEHSVTRSRYVFTISTIAGLIIILGLFNANLSWIRNSLDRARAANPSPPHLAHLEHALYEDLWVFTIPLIGVKASVLDLSVIGPVAMTVLSLWQFYSIRREMLSVAEVADEATATLGENVEKSFYLFRAVSRYFVFTRTPALGLGEEGEPVAMRRVLRILTEMPWWVPTLIGCWDLGTLFVPNKVQFKPNELLWFSLHQSERVEVVLRLVICFSFACFAWWIVKKIRNCETIIQALLTDLANQIRAAKCGRVSKP